MQSLERKMASKKLGQVFIRNSALFLCDMQEKFRPTIQYFPQIVEVASRMYRAAKIMEIPTIITEQYPKGKVVLLFFLQIKVFFLSIQFHCVVSLVT